MTPPQSTPLNVTITPHRELLPADSTEQKLFLMLKLRPTREIAATRPSTAFAFIIDTSSSMGEPVLGEPVTTGQVVYEDGKQYHLVTGTISKLDIVMDSLQRLIHSGRLSQSDRVSIIQFNDNASTVIGLTPATQVDQLENAIAHLQQFSGGTRMGLGMQQALTTLSSQNMTIRRAILFTDGQTVDDDDCKELARQFANANIPITALGVGDYEEKLLIHLSDTTGGSLFHIVPEESANGTQVAITQLPATLIEEFSQAQQEVITNLKMTVKTVKGVKLSRIVRAYPTPAEFPLTQDPYPIGNAAGNDETIVLLEFAIESRSAGKIRIAQLGLTYDIPGQQRRGELPMQNLVVQFVEGQMAAQIDPEVMGYLQQCNIAQLVDQAAQVADHDPDKANEILERARKMTQKLGNDALTRSIASSQDELRKTRKLSSDSRKTVKMGAKSKTVKMNTDEEEGLSEEQIRQISGT